MDSRYFSTTKQINSGKFRLSFFANNLYGELGIAEIRATMVDFEQLDTTL